MKRIQKIDIHAHATCFPDYFPKHFWSKHRMVSAEELIGFYDRLDIEMGVLLPISAAEGQCSVISSESCKYLSDLHPDRFLWFCGVDPRAGWNTKDADLSFFLSHYKEMGAKGLGELTANIPADDPLIDNLFTHLEKLDMPVTIHISPTFGGGYGIIDSLGLPAIEKMLEKHPSLRLLGHSQPFWAEISADAAEETRGGYPKGKVKEGRLSYLLRKYPNLYCDLSAGSGMNALRRDAEFAAEFIEEFSNRLLYGCDMCAVINTHQFEFDAFLTDMRAKGMISEENYAKIVRNNAIDLLKLPLEKA